MQRLTDIKQCLRGDNMTDNEIIKADELISKLHKYCLFSQMKMGELNTFTDSDFDCLHNLTDTINRLKVNEEKNENIIRLADKTIEKQQAEIERLREGMNFERERVDNIPNLLLQARSEARKEFAERLKERIGCKELPNDERKLVIIPIVVVQERIDNLLKEMEGK